MSACLRANGRHCFFKERCERALMQAVAVVLVPTAAVSASVVHLQVASCNARAWHYRTSAVLPVVLVVVLVLLTLLASWYRLVVLVLVLVLLLLLLLLVVLTTVTR
jgi:hypothetical protein